MTALRLVPVAPFAVEGVVAGAIRVRLWHYTLGTFLGMLPGALVATVFGDQIAVALEGSTRINWWLVAGIVAALPMGVLAIRRWFGRLV